MGRVGLYGRPFTGQGTRAAIKAPTHPYTAPAPTDADELFLRLMLIGRPQGAPLYFTRPTCRDIVTPLKAEQYQ
jgi:hypothetical protein